MCVKNMVEEILDVKIYLKVQIKILMQKITNYMNK